MGTGQVVIILEYFGPTHALHFLDFSDILFLPSLFWANQPLSRRKTWPQLRL